MADDFGDGGDNGKRKRLQSSESRDLASAKARRQQPRQASTYLVESTPTPIDPDDEITEPGKVLDGELSDDQIDAFRRAGLNGSDPLTRAEGLKILLHIKRRLDRASERERTLHAEGISEIRKLVARPPNEAITKLQESVADLTDKVEDHERFLGSQRRILNWIGGGLITAVLAVGGWLYYRGVDEGAGKVRIDHLEKIVDRLIDKLETSQKGQIP